MMTIDGRTREEIQKVYKFLQSDDFWMRNVQSTDKLRAKFDLLITKTVEPINNNHGKLDAPKTADEKLNARIAANNERLNRLFNSDGQ